MRLREDGNLAASMRHLQRALDEHPTNPQLHLDLGIALGMGNRLEEAVPTFLRAIDLAPKLATAHFCLAVALLNLGRERAALAPLQQAAALAPNRPEVQRMLGGLLSDWGWTQPAVAAFLAAAAAASSPGQAHYDTAMAQYTEGHRAEAKTTFLLARACDPNNPLIAMKLGSIYAEEGQFAEAEQELRSVLARDPRQADAAFQLFNAVKARETDRSLLAELTANAALPSLTAHARMMFGFALGRAYDHLGEYVEAMRHFDVGNAIRASIAPLDRAALARDADRIIEAFPFGSLPMATAKSMKDDERAVFIVGLPRSGTTLVEQILSSHPLVTAGGELSFWTMHGPTALDAGEDVLAPLGAAYCALFDKIGAGAARITDKNPFNFCRLGLLRRALPQARIVHVRRTPIDTVLSLHTTYLSSRNNFFFGDREDLLFFYDTYVRLMEHWRKVLPPERFIEIDYESVVEDREAQTRRLVEFCGLDWDDACLQPERNDRAVTTASLWQVRQPVYRQAIGRWRNYPPVSGKLSPPPAGGV